MKKHIFFYLLAALALAGCTNEDIIFEENIQGATESTIEKFTVSANDYESDDAQTRSAISKDLKFSWKSGDAIGVYPETGVQLRFPLESGDDSQTATFDGEGWDLIPSMKYAAYYPVNDKALYEGISGTEIPISYRNQMQMDNGSTNHLGKYDYMVATSISPSGNSINFDFKHIGSILYFELPIETTSTYTKLSLVASESVFTNSATLNVFTGELTPATLGATVSMGLNNFTISAGGTLNVWMMIAPANLSGKKLRLIIEDETGKEYKINDIQGSNFESEKAYCLANETSSFSELTYAQLVDGLSFNNTIKSLAKGSEVINGYSVRDEKIEKIVFDCNSRVKTGRSVGNGIYANYDGNGTITISTAADMIELNDDSGSPFFYLTKLQIIENISSLYTGNVTNMNAMFSYCNSLTSLDVSGFDTSNVTDMDNMFSGCYFLTSIDVSNFDTGNVTDMGGMFASCHRLTNIDVGNFDTSNVTVMGMMFYECAALTTLDLSNFDTSNVTVMGMMFYECAALTTLDLSNFDTSNVTNMSCMFWCCYALESLDVSNFKTGKVTDMNDMFYGCSSLTSLDLSNFETGNVTDMSMMFNGCSSLTSLDLSNFDTRKVTEMSSIFGGCSSLSSLDISSFDTSILTNMIGMFANCSSLTNLDVSNLDTGKVTDMRSMFSGCSSLTSLDLSNFVTNNVTNMNYMFSGCSSLTSLDLSNFDTRNVTEMREVFSGCSSLLSVGLRNFDTRNVSTMYRLFFNCKSLKNLDLSNFDTGNVTDMTLMFHGCSSLTSLDLSNFVTDNVTYMYGMFMFCNSLKLLDLSNFDTNNVTDMYALLYDCTSLSALKLGINFIINDKTRTLLMLASVGNDSHCTIYNGTEETVASLKKSETRYNEKYISFETI